MSVSPGAWWHEARRRAVLGGLVGGGVFFLPYLVARLAGVVGHPGCVARDPLGCVAIAATGAAALRVLVGLLPWPLLRAAGIRRAWRPVALAMTGILASYAAFGVTLSRQSSLSYSLWSAVLAGGLYAGAALVTTSGPYRLQRQAGAGCLLIAYVIATGVLSGSGLVWR